jgi:hypothetical protein
VDLALTWAASGKPVRRHHRQSRAMLKKFGFDQLVEL